MKLSQKQLLKLQKQLLKMNDMYLCVTFHLTSKDCGYMHSARRHNYYRTFTGLQALV